MSRILLVDDDELLRSMLRIAIGKMGHTVVEAANGNEALARCTEEVPELVLTDIIMPEREGLETIGQMRQRYPKLRIIAMSGGSRLYASDVLKAAKLMGACDILEKPFTNQQLASALETALAG